MKETTVNAFSRNRARFVPPSIPVGDASLEGLQERMRSASQVEAEPAAAAADTPASPPTPQTDHQTPTVKHPSRWRISGTASD